MESNYIKLFFLIILSFGLTGCISSINGNDDLKMIKTFNYYKERSSLVIGIYYIPFDVLQDRPILNANQMKEECFFKAEVKGVFIYDNDSVCKALRDLNRADYTLVKKPKDVPYYLYCEIYRYTERPPYKKVFLFSFIDTADVIILNGKYAIKHQKAFSDITAPFIPKD
jgi:hypothetical protein